MEEFAIASVIVLIIILINVANWIVRLSIEEEPSIVLFALMIYVMVYLLFATLVRWTSEAGIYLLPK